MRKRKRKRKKTRSMMKKEKKNKKNLIKIWRKRILRVGELIVASLNQRL